jgi:hypothetical protein
MVHTDSRMQADEPVEQISSADYDARLDAVTDRTAA